MLPSLANLLPESRSLGPSGRWPEQEAPNLG